jgi:hypothetical protein
VDREVDRKSVLGDKNWIPLMDYAIKRGVSLSTLRRHIKANKIEYRVENGRYLVPDDSGSPTPAQSATPAPAQLQGKLQRVERDLAKAQEEIAELKMLIALYEEKMAPQRLDS